MTETQHDLEPRYEEDASFLPDEDKSAGEYLPNYALEKVKRFMGLEGVEWRVVR